MGCFAGSVSLLFLVFSFSSFVVLKIRFSTFDRRILTIAYHQRPSSSFFSAAASTSSSPSAALALGPGLQIYDCTDLGSIKELLNINLDFSFLSDETSSSSSVDGDFSSGSASNHNSKTKSRTKMKTRIIDVAVLHSSPLDDHAKEVGNEDESPFIGILLESMRYSHARTVGSSGAPSSPRPSVQDEFEFDFDHQHHEDLSPQRGHLLRSRSTSKHHTTTLAVYSLRTHRIVRKIALGSGGRCVSGCRIISGGNGRAGKEGIFGVVRVLSFFYFILVLQTTRVVYSSPFFCGFHGRL